MSHCLLILAMVATTFVDDDPKATDADLRLGHSLISGLWEYVSYVDNGETLGLRLIRERYAEDGKMTIGNRVIQVNSPEGGEAQVRGYRINPAAAPKQIDLTNANDQVQRGIYRFEDDQLVLCYQKEDGGERPRDFTSAAGSNRVLIRLRLARGASEPGPKRKDPLEATPVLDPEAIPPDADAGAGAAGDPAPASLDLDVRRAHQLLTGVWRLDSMVDNGDLVGRRMIDQKVARDGKVTISHRVFEFINPVNGQTRVSTYRIDPASTPRRINLTNSSGQVLRGIYQFEGDDLVVCFHHRDDGRRPRTFEAAAGSLDVLLRLKMVDSEPPSPPRREEEPRPGRIDLVATTSSSVEEDDAPIPIKRATRTTTSTSPAPARPIAPEPPRKPSEAELQRAHALLAGKWQYVSVVDDGETLSADLIRRKLARDGKMVISNREIAVVSPSTGERRISTFRINPTTNPRQIDVINQFDAVLPGIYRFEGDQLWICLHENEDGDRPADFEAPAGSNNRLLHFRMAPPEPAARPAPPPEPTAEERERQKEARIRRMLVGSWTYADTEGTVRFDLRSDGTFTSTRYWSKAVKRLFEGGSTFSSGTWSYSQGRVFTTVTGSENVSRLGQTAAFRLEEIGATNMIAADFRGQVRDYRKVR